MNPFSEQVSGWLLLFFSKGVIFQLQMYMLLMRWSLKFWCVPRKEQSCEDSFHLEE